MPQNIDGEGKKSIKYYIYSGMLFAFPVGVTIWFVAWVIRFFDSLVLWLLPEDPYWQNLFFQFPGYGFLASLLFLFLLGFICRTFLGERLMAWGDKIMARMPIIGAVYGTGKKIAHAFAAHNDGALRKVALMEYPTEGTWCLCFVTGDAPDEAYKILKDKDLVSVFLPTAPNPTSGILMIVPLKKLKILDMPANEGMRFVVTAGMSEKKGQK